MTHPSSSHGTRASLDRVYTALLDGGFAPNKRADSFQALCPVHGDTKPSLSVRYDAADGKVLLHCFSCNAPFSDLCGALNLIPQDLFDSPLPDRSASTPKRENRVKFQARRKAPAKIISTPSEDDSSSEPWEITATYTYTDDQGQPVQEVVREERGTPSGGHEKRFVQRFASPTGNGKWVKRKPEGFTPVLYNLPAVIDALNSGREVWLVEGEKDAHSATKAGLIATTNPGGSGSFHPEMAASLAGGTIHIVVDRDSAGFKRALTLRDLLAPLGSNLRVFMPVVPDDKADLTDHLDAGFGINDLVEISLVDAQLLQLQSEVTKILSQITTSHDEAIAQLDQKTEDSQEKAEIWVELAQTQFSDLHTKAAHSIDLSGATSAGHQAHEDLPKIVEFAAEKVRDMCLAVGSRIPSIISDALQQSPNPPAEPPFFRGEYFSRHNDDDEPNIGTHYVVRRGETVQVKREKDGDGYRNRYHRTMRGWAEVETISVPDNGAEVETTQVSHGMTVNFFRWIRDSKYNPILDNDGLPQIETARVHWDADQMKDGSWAQALPWPNMLEKSSRTGRETAWDALFSARPAPRDRTTVYVTTGWRNSEEGRFFIHGGGAVDASGSRELEIDLPGKFGDHYQMPAPSSDAAELRQAWIDGTQPIQETLPARIIAPLLGFVWESVFEPVPLVLHFYGAKAASKTSIARLGMQYFAPEMCYQKKHLREILSGANSGSSLIGLVRALGLLNDLPVLVDDVAPDGDVRRAQKKLSELARLVYNGTSRTLGKQRGGISSDASINSTVITTGEMSITGSSLTRLFGIPLDPGMIKEPRRTFPLLETAQARNARGLLGASLIRWIAENHTQLEGEFATTQADKLNILWNEKVDNLPHEDGVKGRLVESAVAADHGTRLMLKMLIDTGAITQSEANEFWLWSSNGIFEALALQDSTSSDDAESMLSYLREALISGNGHLTTETGSAPQTPSVLGWTIRGHVHEQNWAPTGPRLGVIKEDRLYLFPKVALGVAAHIAARADETFSATSVSIASSMTSKGWINPDAAGKRSVARLIDGSKIRVWDLPLTVLTDENPDLPATDPTPDPTNPELPFTEIDVPNPADSDVIGKPVLESEPAESTLEIPDTGTQAETIASTPQSVKKSTTRSTQHQFRASVAVIHTDGIWLPDGTNIPQVQIEHLGDIAKLIHQLHLGTLNGRRVEDGQILVTKEAALALGIPLDKLPNTEYSVKDDLKELTANHPMIMKALAAGFKVGGNKQDSKTFSLQAYTKVWHEENRNLRGRFVLIPALRGDVKSILEEDPTPLQIAQRFQLFADALHFPYAVSASTTAIDLMVSTKRTKEDKELYFAPSKPVEPALIKTLEADINWTRTPTEEEAKHKFIHAYDRGGSYLAGAGSLELGFGSANYYPQGLEFDKKLPGYWRIEMPKKSEWLWPNPLDPRRRNEDITGELTWVTTPTMEIAIDQGYEPTVHEAYVWENHTRILDTYYARVREARTSLSSDQDPDAKKALALLKQTYVQGFGLMASPLYQGRTGYSPERYHFIQARARANIIRKIRKIGNETGRWPVAVYKDTVLYTSNESDPKLAWPGAESEFGYGLGQYKAEKSGFLSDQIQFLDGFNYRGKPELDIF